MRRFRGTWQLRVFVGTVIVLVLALAVPTRSYLRDRADLAAARAELAEVQGSVDQLTEDLRRYDDPAWVATAARERLGWARPGETVYRVEGATTDEAARSDTSVAPAGAVLIGPWYQRLWTSIQAAGRSTVLQPTDVGPAPTAVQPGTGQVIQPASGASRMPSLPPGLPTPSVAATPQPGTVDDTPTPSPRPTYAPDLAPLLGLTPEEAAGSPAPSPAPSTGPRR